MTPEAQRIAIAEAYGTHQVAIGKRPDLEVTIRRLVDVNGRTADFWEGGSSCDIGFRHPADYLNDLNAMHEAENACIYAPHCALGMLYSAQPTIAGFISATAAQRAEAFLRAIGKWEDGK